MDIIQKIDEIIKKRNDKLENVQVVQSKLSQFRNVLSQLDRTIQEVSSEDSSFDTSVEANRDIAEKIRCISTKNTHKKLNETQSELDRLYARFSRKELHISFVGRAGQGKSFIMQKISGLKGEVIPSSDGSDCTGAKSIITNYDGGTVKAKITFYSHEEYIHIINKYVSGIAGSDKYNIYQVNEISKIDISVLEAKDASKAALLQQLKKYIAHSDEILNNLGCELDVEEHMIQDYVAQYDSKDNKRKFYNYLGVKVANIFCSFPYANCGKIVLVDTIGLGDTSLGVREKMLETVSSDSDAILLLSRPDALRSRIGQEDIDIISDIEQKVTLEYSKNMLFFVINKVTSGNSCNQKNIKEVLDGLNSMTLKSSISQIVAVDCNNEKEVESELLLPVLEKLTHNLPEMDALLLDKINVYLEELYDEYSKIAAQVHSAWSKGSGKNLTREFTPTIKKVYGEMTDAIGILYKKGHYHDLLFSPCEPLQEDINQRLLNLSRAIPKAENVHDEFPLAGSSVTQVYINLTDQLRNDIINEFLEVNITLNDLARGMKYDIASCMANQGRLQALINFPLEKDNVDDWLMALKEKFAEDEQFAPLESSLDTLCRFELRMETFLIFLVSAQLSPLETYFTTPRFKDNPASTDVSVEEILFWINHNLETIRSKIREDLEPLYSYPNTAIWAVIKDFYERVRKDKNANQSTEAHKQQTVEQVWTWFYEDHISTIWSDEHQTVRQQQGISEQWNTLVKEIQKYNDKEVFRFR